MVLFPLIWIRVYLNADSTKKAVEVPSMAAVSMMDRFFGITLTVGLQSGIHWAVSEWIVKVSDVLEPMNFLLGKHHSCSY